MKIGITGAAGRMGQMLTRQVTETKGAKLHAASEQPGSPSLGRDAGELAGLGALQVKIGADPAALFAAAEAVIDFTAPAATLAHAGLAARHKRVLVIGTTGIDAAGAREIEAAAKSTAIVWAPNMSLGVNLLMALAEQVARALDPDYDIEIVEMHHKHKVDAPSGTALGLGRAAAKGRGVPLDQVWVKSRDGHTGARQRGAIGFATLRGGDVVGDHTVVFAGEGERIELTHKAASRVIYARGAVRAALWAHGKPPGLYSMHDVLGL
ncbi:MAG: 4-hydroxy-tetrahydrodipicolinate reductase [Alphaproteobacteria bacterium]|nr:4-hydroxy-tetrahydrodipicolinate reductase [Alphaproteobacteria bacterium]